MCMVKNRNKQTNNQKPVFFYQIGIFHLVPHVCCLLSFHNAPLRRVRLHPLYTFPLGSCRQRYDLPWTFSFLKMNKPSSLSLSSHAMCSWTWRIVWRSLENWSHKCHTEGNNHFPGLLSEPRMQLDFLVVRTQCWLMFSFLFSRPSRSFQPRCSTACTVAWGYSIPDPYFAFI